MSEQIQKVEKASNVDLARVKEVSNQIQINDTASVMDYGNELQRKLGDFSNDILRSIKESDNSEINSSINELLNEISSIEGDNSTGFFSSVLSRVPFLKKTVNTAKNMLTKYEGVQSNIDDIVLKIDKNRLVLAQDNNALSDLYSETYGYMKELQVYIEAAKLKRVEIANEIASIDTNSLDVDEQFKLQDLKSLAIHLDRKIQNLTMTGTVAYQTLPQIRVIQENNSVIIDKVNSTINNTIPMWKNQIVVNTALSRQASTIQMQKSVDDTTNKILIANSESLNENAIATAIANERGTVDVDTLKTVSDNLMSTLNEIRKIQDSAVEDRKKAEIEMTKIKDNLSKFLSDKGTSK